MRFGVCGAALMAGLGTVPALADDNDFAGTALEIARIADRLIALLTGLCR